MFSFFWRERAILWRFVFYSFEIHSHVELALCDLIVGLCVIVVVVKAMSTHTTLSLVYWKFHSSNYPYHSLCISFFLSHCLLTVIQTRVSLSPWEILMSGQILNLAANPFSWNTYIGKAAQFTIWAQKIQFSRDTADSLSRLSGTFYLAQLAVWWGHLMRLVSTSAKEYDSIQYECKWTEEGSSRCMDLHLFWELRILNNFLWETPTFIQKKWSNSMFDFLQEI